MTRFPSLAAAFALALTSGLVAVIAPASAADYRNHLQPRAEYSQPQLQYAPQDYGPSPAEIWFFRHHHRHHQMFDRRFDQPQSYGQLPPPHRVYRGY